MENGHEEDLWVPAPALALSLVGVKDTIGGKEETPVSLQNGLKPVLVHSSHYNKTHTG